MSGSFISRLTTVCLVAGLVLGTPLLKDDKRDEELAADGGPAKSRHPRQVAFLPFIAVPPVYQINQIILVNPSKCGPEGELTDRFGDDEDKQGTPAPTQSPAPVPTEPSPCVWSIVACCAPGSTNIRYACFELLGCLGAFWDTNPCEKRVVQAAANTALKFYESNSTATRS